MHPSRGFSQLISHSWYFSIVMALCRKSINFLYEFMYFAAQCSPEHLPDSAYIAGQRSPTINNKKTVAPLKAHAHRMHVQMQA